jgi:hypothetical protein
MKIFRTTLVLGVLVCLASTAMAKTISPDEARTAAVNFFYERINQQEVTAVKDLNVTEERSVMKDGLLLYYVINFSKDGWILMSGDDRFIPVIAYGFKGSYASEDLSCCHRFWMQKVEEQLSASLKENAPALQEATLQWNDLLNRDASNLPVFKSKAVAPMMLATWDQGKYYNALCPVASDGPDGRSLVGCVATSMSQIMFFYRFPAQGIGSHGGITFSNYQYRWNEMLNELSAHNQGVAEICYHAGVAVNMSYTGTGSGAQSTDIPGALESHFGYSTACNYQSAFTYSASNWASMMVANLDAGHPMIYSGSDPTEGGHAWVCDGYQGTNYFHMNWGWSGAYNGYFYVNNLAAGGLNFSDWQGCVFDIYPPTSSYPSYCTGSVTVPYTFGTIEDGSGPSNYGNNANCQWLIDPTEVVSKISISFNAFTTEASNDKVIIYDGDNTSAPVLATYSGSTAGNVQTTGDKALVTFTSNGSTTSSGWQLEYHASYPVYCSGITTLTTPTGSFSDGSGALNYSYNQLCRWRIEPPSATSITVNFSSFNVATDDVVVIADGNTGISYDSLRGSSMPAQKTYTTSKLLVYFKTNSANNAAGWDLNYTSTQSGVQESEAMGSCSVYPNPASHNLYIDFSPLTAQEVNFEILSIDGRQIYVNHAGMINNRIKLDVDLSNVPAGLYFLRVSSDKGNMITKFIVE